MAWQKVQPPPPQGWAGTLLQRGRQAVHDLLIATPVLLPHVTQSPQHPRPGALCGDGLPVQPLAALCHGEAMAGGCEALGVLHGGASGRAVQPQEVCNGSFVLNTQQLP